MSHHTVHYEATCTACSKRSFRRRRDAQTVAKQIPGTHMTAYRCPDGRGWHLGHLPRNVRRGLGDKAGYEAMVARKRRAS